MPRQARLDVPGILHHVIIRGIEHGLIFTGRSRNRALSTMMARTFGMTTQHAITYVVRRGREVTRQKEYTLERNV